MQYFISFLADSFQYELVKQISANPNNLVVGLVRDKAATERKLKAELGARSNVHILHGDLASCITLNEAAVTTAHIIGERGIDYLVANGAYASQFDAYDAIGVLYVYRPDQSSILVDSLRCMFIRADKVEELEKVSSELFQTNVVGNIHLFKSFLPLVMKGKVKKVIAISSGHADLDFINDLEVENSTLYAASKAAMNVIVAKFNAQYKKDGVLFVSMSPGVVEVGHFDNGMSLCCTDEGSADNLAYSNPRTDGGFEGFLGQAFHLCPRLQRRHSG
jgi:NAD(P)-dependent dehydrogenase (short-subunit alcohol dehydrogenase family)